MIGRSVRGVLVLLLAAAPVMAAEEREQPAGFLCCNLRTNDAWISDINYAEPGATLIPAGTPLKVTGYGRHRVYVEFGTGDKQAIGNDYSRDIPLETFAKRYVVPIDPNQALAGFAPEIRQAITTARLRKGMTREQVVMAVGYPVSSENPNLESSLWRYWLDSETEFRVMFDEQNRVARIEADPAARSQVVME